MTAEALITAFFARGIRFIANPPKLTVEPASRLTEADRELIRAHKPALLDFLLKGQEERTKTGEATLSNRGPCGPQKFIDGHAASASRVYSW